MLRVRFLIILCAFFIAQVDAVEPVSTFKKSSELGSVINYVSTDGSLDLGQMDSELQYSDLSPDSIKDITKMIEAKKAYGTFFGFKDWKMTGNKFLQENNKRVLLLKGQFTERTGVKINFLEVYWASDKKSGQYLLSGKGKIDVTDFKRYFK